MPICSVAPFATAVVVLPGSDVRTSDPSLIVSFDSLRLTFLAVVVVDVEAEADNGQYVGDATWEERTYKELVRLREEMFWARIGAIVH